MSRLGPHGRLRCGPTKAPMSKPCQGCAKAPPKLPMSPPSAPQVTAATASFFTDGAACTLIMSEDKAKELGLTPKARPHGMRVRARACAYALRAHRMRTACGMRTA